MLLCRPRQRWRLDEPLLYLVLYSDVVSFCSSCIYMPRDTLTLHSLRASIMSTFDARRFLQSRYCLSLQRRRRLRMIQHLRCIVSMCITIVVYSEISRINIPRQWSIVSSVSTLSVVIVIGGHGSIRRWDEFKSTRLELTMYTCCTFPSRPRPEMHCMSESILVGTGR